jgi:hypothetical protein
MNCSRVILLSSLIALGLLGCSAPQSLEDYRVPAPMSEALLEWSARPLPGKRLTQYSLANRAGQSCVLAQATQSVSLLRRALDIDATQLGQIQFDWWIQGMEPKATVTDPDTDDAPARLLLGFAGDEAKLSMRNRLQFELAQALTGEAPPYATLMYVWDAKADAETVVISARSDRIRKIVVGSGARGKGAWQRTQRDVSADYKKAFGEAPGRLVSMALMTDGDNTASRSSACYGSILLKDAAGQTLAGSLQL